MLVVETLHHALNKSTRNNISNVKFSETAVSSLDEDGCVLFNVNRPVWLQLEPTLPQLRFQGVEVSELQSCELGLTPIVDPGICFGVVEECIKLGLHAPTASWHLFAKMSNSKICSMFCAHLLLTVSCSSASRSSNRITDNVSETTMAFVSLAFFHRQAWTMSAFRFGCGAGLKLSAMKATSFKSFP